jgi:hypothetical protein
MSTGATGESADANSEGVFPGIRKPLASPPAAVKIACDTVESGGQDQTFFALFLAQE